MFGCRNHQYDFYYSKLWQQLIKEGILSAKNGLLTAFSRDQKHKIYVQDKLREQGDLLWEVLQQVKSVDMHIAHSEEEAFGSPGK